MPKVIDKNAFYAESYSLRRGAIYGLDGYNDVRRQKRTASRGPFISFPLRSGGAALISRAALSHLRQFEGLLSVLIWGALAAPLAVFVLLDAPLPLPDYALASFDVTFDPLVLKLYLWVSWLMLLLVYPAGAREMSRLFRDDTRNKMVRSKLPFNTLQLLIFDLLPSFIVVCLVSFVAITLLWGAHPWLPWFMLYSVLINIMLALCVALNGLRLPFSQRTLSYELSILVCIFVLFLTTLVGMHLVVAAGIILCILGLASFAYSSEE
jgi:hypothetical protein